MAAGRLQRAAASGLAVCCSLLAAALFGRCSLYKEYVRRGEMVDTLAARVDRLERSQLRGNAQMAAMRADVLTETDVLAAKLDQIDARIVDLTERLERVSRKQGIGHGALIPDPPGSTATDTVTAPPDTAAVAPTDSPPMGVDPDRLYNNAYLDFTRAKHDVALAGFRQFLDLFPDSDMADNALYWVGECHYSLGQLDSAEAEFRRVISDYPDGNKVPTAAYKLGLLLQSTGRNEEARRQLADVVRRWPGTNEARLAQDRLDNER